MDGTPTCPGDFYCSDGSRGYSAIPTALQSLHACAALVSSSLSLLGAALNMIAYCAFKDLRKGTAQTIIAVLSMADFLLASSCIFGAIIRLAYGTSTSADSDNDDCYIFDTLCQVQAFVILWMLGSSFTWTAILAVHFFLVTVCSHSTWPHKLMPLYHIVGWLVPLACTLPMLPRGDLGFNPAYTWTCCIRPTSIVALSQWCTLEAATVLTIFLGYTCVLFTVCLKSVSIGCKTIHTFYNNYYLHFRPNAVYYRSDAALDFVGTLE